MKPRSSYIPRRTRPKNKGGHRIPSLVILPFRAYVRGQKCLLHGPECVYAKYGCIYQSDPAHYRSKNRNGDKENLCPLCRKHHREQHQHGWPAFIEKYSLDIGRELRWVWADYLERAA